MEETRRSFIGKVIGFLGIAAFIPKSLFANSKNDRGKPWSFDGLKVTPAWLETGIEHEGLWLNDLTINFYCYKFKIAINNHENNIGYVCTDVFMGPFKKGYVIYGYCVSGLKRTEKVFSFASDEK